MALLNKANESVSVARRLQLIFDVLSFTNMACQEIGEEEVRSENWRNGSQGTTSWRQLASSIRDARRGGDKNSVCFLFAQMLFCPQDFNRLAFCNVSRIVRGSAT